jgi:hypothetical protein
VPEGSDAISYSALLDLTLDVGVEPLALSAPTLNPKRVRVV